MQRKPDNVKKAIGTYRPDREETKKEVQAAKLLKATPPRWLSKNAKKYFREYFKLLDAWEILTKVDLMGLALICYHLDQFITLGEEIKKTGLTYVDKNGSRRKNPLLTVQKDSYSFIISHGSKYGFTPVDRAGLKLDLTFGDKKQDDEFGDV